MFGRLKTLSSGLSSGIQQWRCIVVSWWCVFWHTHCENLQLKKFTGESSLEGCVCRRHLTSLLDNAESADADRLSSLQGCRSNDRTALVGKWPVAQHYHLGICSHPLSGAKRPQSTQGFLHSCPEPLALWEL